MTNNPKPFDAAQAVASDKKHVWHHITNHKPFEKVDPMVIVKGEGMRVWDAKGNEYLDAVKLRCARNARRQRAEPRGPRLLRAARASG